MHLSRCCCRKADISLSAESQQPRSCLKLPNTIYMNGSPEETVLNLISSLSFAKDPLDLQQLSFFGYALLLDMYSKSTFLATAFLCLLISARASSAECVDLYGQCGGKGYDGPTCCVQPTPLPPYVNYVPPNSNICVKDNPYYSQCKPRCTREEPCLFQSRNCVSAIGGDTDGRGRQYCGMQTACTNPEWCYSDPISCVCGGDVPCALKSRPGGCRAPRPDPAAPELGVCGPGLKRCPAYEGEQCGGIGHTEPTTCQPGLKCIKYGDYYSGCARV